MAIAFGIPNENNLAATEAYAVERNIHFADVAVVVVTGEHNARAFVFARRAFAFDAAGRPYIAIDARRRLLRVGSGVKRDGVGRGCRRHRIKP